MAIALVLALMARSAVAHRTPHTGKLQPLGNVTSWFSTKDYPQEAMVKRQEGVVGFALDVDPSGLPSDCHVTKSSGFPILDDRTCTVMMSRARFRPIVHSVSKKGTAAPIASLPTFRHTMVWKLPVKGQERFADRSFDAKSVIAPTGEVLSCKLTGAGASKLASASGGCGPFGEKGFLAAQLKDDYHKVRSTNVRLSMVTTGTLAPLPDRPPNIQHTLAKAEIDVAPTGEVANCTSTAKLEMPGRSLDLCEFIRADPLRFGAGAPGRKVTLILDLNANY